MTMIGLPDILFNIEGGREWYEDETISVGKNGINGIITQVGAGTTNSSTIIVDKTGLVATTTDVPA